MKEKLSDIRKRKGMSNAGKYPNVNKSNFAGPHGTYPVNTKERFLAALRLVGKADPKMQKRIRAKIISIGKKKGWSISKNG